MTTTASPVSKQTASAAQETGATGAAATAIETIETGVAGVADAATNAAANAIEDLEAAESRGFSTRFPLNSAFIFTFGALGGMLFGFDTGIISGASPLIESDFGLSVSQTGFITSSVLIGSCAGALSIGALSDRFGRKKLLIVSALLFLLGSGLCASSTGFAMMVCARIILGLAVGAASALTPAYLAELAPKERRGSLSTLFQLMVTFGILLAYASNLGFLNHNLFGIRDWRWMLGSALVPAALLLLGGLLLPESPRYLVNKGDTRNAFKVLTLIRKDVDQTQVQIELDEIKAVAAQDTKGGVRELFRIARPALVAAIGIMLFQQLVGINSVIYFLPQVFIKGFGFPEGDAIWVSVGIGVVNFVSTIVATLIMDRFPRKGVLIFGSIVMTVSARRARRDELRGRRGRAGRADDDSHRFLYPRLCGLVGPDRLGAYRRDLPAERARHRLLLRLGGELAGQLHRLPVLPRAARCVRQQCGRPVRDFRRVFGPVHPVRDALGARDQRQVAGGNRGGNDQALDNRHTIRTKVDNS